MARTFRRKDRLTAMSEINVTPLIDLAFALLIIFIITTPLLEQTIEIELPRESRQEQNDPPVEFQTVSINEEGLYYWGDEQVSAEELELLLAELATRSDPPVLKIRGDRNLRYESVIQLIELIKQNNLTKISLDTQVY